MLVSEKGSIHRSTGLYAPAFLLQVKIMAQEMTDKELILEWLEWFEHNQGRAIGSVNKYHRYIQDLSAWLKKSTHCRC